MLMCCGAPAVSVPGYSLLGHVVLDEVKVTILSLLSLQSSFSGGINLAGSSCGRN